MRCSLELPWNKFWASTLWVCHLLPETRRALCAWPSWRRAKCASHACLDPRLDAYIFAAKSVKRSHGLCIGKCVIIVWTDDKCYKENVRFKFKDCERGLAHLSRALLISCGTAHFKCIAHFKRVRHFKRIAHFKCNCPFTASKPFQAHCSFQV